MENFVLGGKDIPIKLTLGKNICQLEADTPKYFSISLMGMKPPGKLTFKNYHDSAKYKIFLSYTIKKPDKFNNDADLCVKGIQRN